MDARQRRRLVILFVIMIFGAFAEILGVSLMIPLVTAIMQPSIIENSNIVSIISDLANVGDTNGFVVICLVALIIVFILKNLYLCFEYYVQARFVFNNQFLIQKNLLCSYLSKPYEYFLSIKSGEIVRVINDDVINATSLLSMLLTFFADLIVSIGLVITILIIDPVITLSISVALATIVLILSKVVKPILEKKGNDFRKNWAISYKWLTESIQGIKEIKVTQNESFFENGYETSGKKVVSANKWNYVFNNIPRLIIEAGCISSTLAVVIAMILMGKELTVLMPTISALAMAAVKLMPSANRISNAVNSIVFQEPALDNLLEIINKAHTRGNLCTIGESTAKLIINNSIEFQDITYRYPGTQRNILTESSMIIPVGKSIGIVGQSGSGKTTAVDIMLGLLNPERGKVVVNGRSITEAYTDWLSHIGYIPQTIFLLDDTIAANVAFGRVLNEEKVVEALHEAKLWEYISSLPNGIFTAIGERGIRLSGGQRQRIGIARALYSNPEIIVFDEATSSLDNETEASIMESINSLHGKKTMIIIAHRLQTIEGCDLVYRVENQKIMLEKGSIDI